MSLSALLCHLKFGSFFSRASLSCSLSGMSPSVALPLGTTAGDRVEPSFLALLAFTLRPVMAF
jgi:hypothetical protein